MGKVDISNPGAPDPAFERLKTLLLSEDWAYFKEIRDRVETLAREIHDKDQLIETLDPVIADLLERKIHESKPEMAEALAPIMGDAIKKQIEDAKEDMVDALYPIVGSMVAKAIQEAMRKMMEEINARINQAANTRFMTFVKSRILRVQPAEILIAEGITFSLEELFLIERRSGLLIAYQSRDEQHTENDAHILGGMLTAIRQFVNDAFQSGGESDLHEIQHENHSIRIDSGRYTLLAAVYQGIPPQDFIVQLRGLHHRIHNRYYKRLRDFQGETAEFQGVSPILNRLIQKYRKHGADVQ
ncbi:MAG TPA: hypothetical protein ENN17_13030 [bacterium]|nr:hypothetical protein [bacterium]